MRVREEMSVADKPRVRSKARGMSRGQVAKWALARLKQRMRASGASPKEPGGSRHAAWYRNWVRWRSSRANHGCGLDGKPKTRRGGGLAQLPSFRLNFRVCRALARQQQAPGEPSDRRVLRLRQRRGDRHRGPVERRADHYGAHHVRGGRRRNRRRIPGRSRHVRTATG
jgi:hypothetical protein